MENRIGLVKEVSTPTDIKRAGIMWTGKLIVISKGGEELDITEELSRREHEQLDIIVEAVYRRFWNRKGENEEVFKSTPEYDAEMLRDEHIIEKVRREREKEGIKEEKEL